MRVVKVTSCLDCRALEQEHSVCQIEDKESPTDVLCPDWCPLRKEPVMLELHGWSNQFSKERRDTCLWCRLGYPLAEAEPEHEWHDEQSKRWVSVPCYFDMIEDVDE